MQIKAKKKVILICHPDTEPTGQQCGAEEKGGAEQAHAARTSVKQGGTCLLYMLISAPASLGREDPENEECLKTTVPGSKILEILLLIHTQYKHMLF